MSLSDEYKKIESVLMHLPRAINEEIRRIVRTRSGLLEIRLRRYGLSELIFGTGRVGLGSRLSGDDMDRILASLTEGSLYAHRGSIAEGFITLRGGIRVAVVGVARYEGSALVGVSDVSSLNLRMQREPFRIKEVEEAFQLAKRGLLVFSPPGVGKTTALRALVLGIGVGAGRKTVSVIDERREFPPESFPSASVDIYSGYSRVKGIEAALRASSPEVIVVDEITSGDEAPEVIVVDEISGGREAELISEHLLSGVKIAASAHVGSFEELKDKPSLKPFFNIGAFDVALGIERRGSEYFYEVRMIDV